MNADEPAESATTVKVNFVKALDRHMPPTPQVMPSRTVEGAGIGSLNFFVKLAAFIAAVLVALVVVRVSDFSTSLAFILLITQAVLLVYGFFVWLHPRR